MENQDARNHSLWATLRVDFQLHRNKLGNEEVAHHRTSPNPFLSKFAMWEYLRRMIIWKKIRTDI